jgi:glycosyltransferase involved in cell wall biosynthesis
MRGGEKVLEQILQLYPDADIFTLICDKKKISPAIAGHKITTSFLQNIPGIFASYRNFLPLFPAAIESFDMRGYGLIISSSHCVAKGVKPGNNAHHACYCHTPMRYAWDQFPNYFSPKRNGRVKYALIASIMPGLRNWDVKSSVRVDEFMANSTAVKDRILKYYARQSTVVHPPVDTDFYTPAGEKGDFYLMVSALTEYKKVDYAVDIFNKLPDKKLVIIGGGPLLKSISARAKSNVTVLGYQSAESIREHYRRAKAFIFPGEEDFGITMAESLACATPVMAYYKGGSRDIVTDGITGEFFDGSADGFIKTLEKMGNKRYDDKKMRDSALAFSEKNFREKFSGFIKEKFLI